MIKLINSLIIYIINILEEDENGNENVIFQCINNDFMIFKM